MLESYLIKGLLIGLIFGVPAGAIGALTIQRSLEQGFFAGLVTGMGSSAVDLLYACVGVFGIAAISDFLLANQKIISIFGGILICVFGIFIFTNKKRSSEVQNTKSRLLICFTSSSVIAIMNPATILSFFIAFATFNIESNLTAVNGIQLVVGIFLGTLFWWTGLSGFVALFRKKLTDKIYIWLKRILGCLMVLFGIAVIIREF